MYSYLSFPIERKRFQDIVLNKYGLSVELLFFSGHIQGITEGLMLGGTVKIFTKTSTLDQTKLHFYIASTIICIFSYSPDWYDKGKRAMVVGYDSFVSSER